jgi:hypothetical protein
LQRHGHLDWDDRYLHVGLEVRDNEMLNKQIRKYLYREDSVEPFVSAEPRDARSGFGPGDHQFFHAPISGGGTRIVGEVTDREAGVVKDVDGARTPVRGMTSAGAGLRCIRILDP